jgi:hypothetical protein
MKKLLLLAFLATSVGTNAQTLYSENFNGTPTLSASGWTLLDQDGDTNNWLKLTFTGNNVMGSYSWFNGAVLNPNNYAFSPAIDLTNVTGPLKLSYKHAALDATWDAENYSLYITTAPTVALATAATLVHNQTTMNSINTLTEISFDVSSYAGQIVYLCWRHHNVSDQFILIVDDIKLEKLLPNDLELSSVTVPFYLPAGNFTFLGQVQNKGSNAVTSYAVTWQTTSGTINTTNVMGVNIATGDTHSFTHSVPLNAVVGPSYALTFNVPTVNGVADGNTLNNSLLKNTQVPSGSTTYKPMIEKFTGSTCPPCASYNNATFNPYFAAQNQNFNYVAYQMNFPGTGDPYYTAEAGVRFNYYGLSGITAMIVDGASYSTQNNQAAITTHINSQATKPAYFGLTASRNLTGNTAVVNYTITPYLSGNFVLYAAVIEKLTTGNIGTNGETSFKHVMMKMVPNASGTPLNFTAGTTLSGTVTASLAGTFIEQIGDCEVVLYLQNPVTKEIMQSFTALDVLSTQTNTLNTAVKLYPNPSSSVVRISNAEEVDVNITDLTGKTVMSLKNVTDQMDINVSALTSGMYLFTVSNETTNQTIKFIKK